jgi:hypothetical protein
MVVTPKVGFKTHSLVRNHPGRVLGLGGDVKIGQHPGPVGRKVPTIAGMDARVKGYRCLEHMKQEEDGSIRSEST